MTIQKARQILREEALGLSDQDVGVIIKNCSDMSDIFLDMAIEESQKRLTTIKN